MFWIAEFSDSSATNQKPISDNFLHSVKWGIDWIMKSIVTDEEMNIKEVFVQVGDPDKEHKETAWNFFPVC